MLQVAGLTVQKVIMLLLFIATGYLLRKSGKLPENAGKVLSALSATVFCPAYNLRHLWLNFTVAKIGENALVMGYGLLFTLLAIGLALVLAIKEGTKPVLNAIFGGHPFARSVRYFLMVMFAACVWPMTFGWLQKKMK
jgi:predicted permease